MTAAVAGGFLRDFVSRLAPTLAFSALPAVMTLTENPQALDTDEGRKQMGAMVGASLLSGVIGAGMGSSLNALGSKFFPGPTVRAVRPEVNEGLNVLNRKGLGPKLTEAASLSEIDDRLIAATKGMKGKQLENAQKSVEGLKKYLGNPIDDITQQSGVGQSMGMVGDVIGGMATWSPIYNAIAGPQPALDPSQAHEVTGVMGAGSQDMYIDQQIAARLLQGDGLPVEAYAPGTMFNRSGLPSYERDPYDLSYLAG